MTPEIRTERLLLRGWREADKVPYAALNADPDVMRHFVSPLSRHQSDEMVDRMAATWDIRGFGLWAVERLDTSTFIGFVGLSSPAWHVDSVTPCVEIGWRLARAQWGKGFAPEAGRAVLTWGFERVELPRDEIVSFTTTLNRNSRRVMEKLAMMHDPTRDFDHPLTPGWAEQRQVVYVIDRPTWQAGVAR